MKTIEELLEEVGRRMSKRNDGLVPTELWNTLKQETIEAWGEQIQVKMQTHENLLRIAVCINERAIDAWIDGLIEIQRNN